MPSADAEFIVEIKIDTSGALELLPVAEQIVSAGEMTAEEAGQVLAQFIRYELKPLRD